MICKYDMHIFTFNSSNDRYIYEKDIGSNARNNTPREKSEMTTTYAVSEKDFEHLSKNANLKMRYTCLALRTESFNNGNTYRHAEFLTIDNGTIDIECIDIRNTYEPYHFDDVAFTKNNGLLFLLGDDILYKIVKFTEHPVPKQEKEE